MRVGRTVVALVSRLGDAVAPPEVILLADRLGVLPQLSRWLIMHSVRMISELTAQGMALRLSLNLTAADMRDEELPDLISQGLRTWRVNPSQLTLEITETALLSDEVRVRQVIVRLRELGCDVALDDFGTGFSSLAYLRTCRSRSSRSTSCSCASSIARSVIVRSSMR